MLICRRSHCCRVEFYWIVALALLLGCGEVAAGQEAAATKPLIVEVTGLSIQKSLAGQENQPRTEVKLKLRGAEGTIVAIKKVESSLLRLVDQSGNELARLEFLHAPSWDGGITRDISIDADRIPAPGTTQLKVTGQVLVRLGYELQTQRIDVKFAVGQALRLGEVATEIEAIRKVDEESMLGGLVQLMGFASAPPSVEPDGSTKLEVTFKTALPQGFDAIHALSFIDPRGSVLESRYDSSSSESSVPHINPIDGPPAPRDGSNRSYIHRRSYHIEKLPPAGAVEVKYFKRIEEVTIPIEVTVGLGL